MMRDVHDEARDLIGLGDGLSNAQQSWLRGHLENCEACRNFAEAVGQVAAALHTLPIAADSRLVRATQTRVRFHAARLREARERMWLVGLACFAVGLSSAVTAPLWWRLFAWLGERAGVPGPVWEGSFVVFWIVPAVVVSVILMAHGVHISGVHRSSNGERSR